MKHLKKYNESFENILDIPTLKDIMYYITDHFDCEFDIKGDGDDFKFYNNAIYLSIGSNKINKFELECQSKDFHDFKKYMNRKKSEIEEYKVKFDNMEKKIDDLVNLMEEEIPGIISILEKYDNFEKMDFTLFSDKLLIVIYIKP